MNRPPPGSTLVYYRLPLLLGYLAGVAWAHPTEEREPGSFAGVSALTRLATGPFCTVILGNVAGREEAGPGNQ
jgi:hypothetical protein